MNFRTRCCRKLSFVFALLATAFLAVPAFAQTCLQDEFNAAGNKQKLNCTANDVRVAQVTSVRDLNGNPLTTCFQGTTFSFLADFEIVTSSTSSRSNIGLYFANQGQANALKGSCVDNIVSPLHQCPNAATGIQCGSDNYHELDPAPDTCGDTSSTDFSPVFGAAAEGVTIEVDNFLCEAFNTQAAGHFATSLGNTGPAGYDRTRQPTDRARQHRCGLTSEGAWPAR